MLSGRLIVVLGALGFVAGACSSEDEQTAPGVGALTPGANTSSSVGTASPGTSGSTGTMAPVAMPLPAANGGSSSAEPAPATPAGTPPGGAPAPADNGGVGTSAGADSSAPSGNPAPDAQGTGGADTMPGVEGAVGGDGMTDMEGIGGGNGAPVEDPVGVGGMPGEEGNGGAAGTPDANGPLLPGNAPVPSAGCGTATTVTDGKKTIMSGGQERSYIIDIPDNYDMNEPYRFFYTSHWISARAEDVVGQDYYFLKPLVERDGEQAIFLAPQALPGDPTGTWDTRNPTDHELFDTILAYVKENLCIDTTRVFATGFSFGGMMTYSLSVNHQMDIRAAVGIAPANYNIYVPPATDLPIAWMQTTGMSDGTCPWVNSDDQKRGAKYIALEHAEDNGCTIPDDVPAWQNGGHTCYDFEGCPEGYPVKACTFGGGHTNIDNEGGENWIATESWDFFKQF